jgi:hypothetical protein
LVAIVPTEYTNHVLLRRLKIFSLVFKIWNLQLALINVALARKRGPMQLFTMLVLKDGATLTEECRANHLQLARSDNKCLERICITNGNEVCPADLWHDKNVGTEVEVNWERDKFVQGKKMICLNERHM